MHRSYQPITESTNKLLKKKWDDTRYNTHRRKVDEAAAVIDNNPPQSYSHLHLKLKKIQIEEERLATIERDNKLLLEKMSCIMRTRGRVDNKNDYQQKSLNKSKRQQELKKVASDNNAILKRIASKEPCLDNRTMMEDWKTNQQLSSNITRYPRNLPKERKTKTRKSIEAEEEDDSEAVTATEETEENVKTAEISQTEDEEAPEKTDEAEKLVLPAI